jgi:hypothetical protein
VCLQKFVRFLRLWCVIYVYMLEKESNVFSVAVIKSVLCLVMVLSGKELMSGHKA